MKTFKQLLSVLFAVVLINFTITAFDETPTPYESVKECSVSPTCYVKAIQGQYKKTLYAVALDGTEYPLPAESLTAETWMQLPYGTSYIHRSHLLLTTTYLPQPQEF